MKPKTFALEVMFPCVSLCRFLRFPVFLSLSSRIRVHSNIENIDYISQGILRLSRSSQFEAFNYAKQSDVLSLARLCSRHPVAILSGGYQRTVNRIPFVFPLLLVSSLIYYLILYNQFFKLDSIFLSRRTTWKEYSYRSLTPKLYVIDKLVPNSGTRIKKKKN